MKAPASSDVRLGLGANASQFGLLVGINALVGGMIGQERTVLPLLAERTFGLAASAGALSFILAFGLTKAATNLVAGTMSDRYGRRPVLIVGWLFALPVPLMLIWAPTWSWVVAANVLLGVNQGLTWSTTVIMKIDLVGPERRGLALGLNEASGYGALALTAWVTGLIAERAGLRPAPFFLGIAFAALGLGLSIAFARETRGHARQEAAEADAFAGSPVSVREVFAKTSIHERALSAACQAGMVNNAVDGLAWGLFPILFAQSGLSVARIGALVAAYPAVWSIGQLVTGPLSDRIGRKWLIAGGMVVQAGALGLMAATTGFGPWLVGAAGIGLGTAMVYPTLIAVIGDVAHPAWRASAVGVYRLWRDAGFALGALVAGITADAVSLRAAILTVAMLTAVSGLVVAVRMYETLPRLGGGRLGPSGRASPCAGTASAFEHEAN